MAQHTVIQIDESFKVLNLSSMCAYGLFDSREEAEEAIATSIRADQSKGCDQ